MMTTNGFSSGCFTEAQAQILTKVARSGLSNPSFLADLEGAGPQAELEAALAKVLGKRHVLTLSSCTAAIHAVLLAIGIGPGDEVIVTPYSWGQSVAPVLFAGATAVFADINPETLSLDPESVRRRITEKTRAILPVHLFGRLADLTPLAALAKENGLALVVDAAHALGCKPAGRQTETAWGDVVCFSLGRGKLVCAGEGGFFATNDENLYERVLLLSQHSSRIVRELGPSMAGGGELGLNYRMHPLAAVLALADFAEMEARLSRRRAVWQAFHEGMGEVAGLVPVQRPQETDVWAAYGLPLTMTGCDKDDTGQRVALLADANRVGLPLRSGPVRVPLHLRLADPPMPVVSHPTHAPGSCPVAEMRCANQELWVLSALDMDGLTVEESRVMGEEMREVVAASIRKDGNERDVTGQPEPDKTETVAISQKIVNSKSRVTTSKCDLVHAMNWRVRQ